MFTVAHDAIHGAVTKNRTVNNLIGFVSQLYLGPTSSWHALKYNHLTHHAHTNDSKLDPDFWASLEGPGGYYLTPLRWLTVDVSYFMTYLPYLSRKPWYHQLGFIAYEAAMIAFIYYSIQMGFFVTLLQYWIIPSRIAVALLAFAFDFLPHYPHDITRKENKYKTTAYIAAPWYIRPFLSLIIFYQNYHIAHHLIPVVPFYEYKRVWTDMRDRLLNEEDIRVRQILPQLGVEELPATPKLENREN
jgi:fatty acid desaturase